MERIRTLLLARSHVVVMDADLAAAAATRPHRDDDVEKFEDELVQLGFVMSLDLALTIRRLPHQAIQELRRWITSTLVSTAGGARPQVPLIGAFPSATPDNTASLYARRILPWLYTRSEQPCPWCSQVKEVGALDPCGHLVCRACWAGGNFSGCAVCHRRVALGDPFVKPPRSNERVAGHDGGLRLLRLGFDLPAMARARFERLISRTTPLTAEQRAEVELVIDEVGPKAAAWLPKRVPLDETRALAVARLWMVSPDRRAILQATTAHVSTATEVLRVAVALMSGAGDLAHVGKLGPLARALRRTVLEALDRLPAEALVEEVMRRPALWKRIGEHLHPFEHAKRLPTAAFAFAAVRGTAISAVPFGPTIHALAARLECVRIEDDRLRVRSWAAGIEAALRAGDARSAAEQLAQRPSELLRRADHVLRLAQPEAIASVVQAIQAAVPRGAPGVLMTLAQHLAARTEPHARRPWGVTDHRPVLPAEVVAPIIGSIHAELLARAERCRHFARAVIDRALDERTRLWTLACVHAVARTNSIYVRERDGLISMYRRREGESLTQRFARVHAGKTDDGTLAILPAANAPTWLAVAALDLELPRGSESYLPDRQGHLVAQLISAR
ncbi:MAG: RING finger family 4 domain-containing protein [Kofleriaceae bacterium]|nr:RING finger family 4 domain-containing protein [Kofleriaceae bacterium]